MSSYEKLLEFGRGYLQEREIPDGELDAWYLLEHLLEKDRSWYFLHMKEEADQGLEEEYNTLIKKRGRHVPLQQITKKAYFMGLEFKVNSHVLIPRQDTEVLVEEAAKRLKKDAKILDLCTGTGCILLSLLYNRDRLNGVGVDISPEALEVARENSRLLHIPATFLRSNLLNQVEGTFDLIVSNPPYIPRDVIEGLMEEVRDYEPRLALDGGEDGLDFYRRITCEAGEYLKPGGWLLMEIGQDQADDVRNMMEAAGYEEIQVVQDLAGLDRVVLGKKHQEESDV